MPHVPSMPDQISRRILARFTSLTGATTANLNGDIATLIGLFAEELSLIDRIFTSDFVRAHWFEGNPQLVIERINDMPLRFPRRRDAAEAVGGAVTVSRTITSAAVTYAAGTIVAVSSSNPGIPYLNASPVIFGIGVGTVTNVTFKCTIPGSAGTLEIGQLDTVQSSPDGNISSVINTAPLVGRDAESADELIARARIWMKSLAQSQREALESVALNFVDDSGVTVTHAHAMVDPDVRGITYLTVDDGAGMAGYTATASPTTGVFTALASGLRHRLMFTDYPAATFPKLKVGTTTFTVSTGAWTSLNEMGEIWLKPNPGHWGINTTPGTAWSIEDYTYYTGILASLQKYINRFCAPSGGRVIVRPPIPQPVTLSGIIVSTTGSGTERAAVLNACKLATMAYVRSLNMGQPLLQHELHVQLSKVPGVINYIPDQSDMYPGGPFYKLVANPTTITFR